MNLYYKKKNRIIRVLAGILIIAVLFLTLNFFRKEIKNFFYYLSFPAQKFFWKAGQESSNFIKGLAAINFLQKEINNLKSRNVELDAENSLLKDIKRENDILRQALNLGLEKEYQFVVAKIIGKDIASDTLTINMGQDNEIEKNMPVITEEKIIIGRISEVYKNFSKVMLVSNKKSVFDAKILEKEIAGEIKGGGNFNVIMDLVPRDKNIVKGDSVITTSFGKIFPAGILAGKVEEVKKNDIDAFQYVKVVPAFDINRIDSLFVIIKY